LQPTNTRQLAEFATQLLHANRRAEAAQVLADALTAAPADTHINELAGYLAATEGRWADAAQRYALALRGRPENQVLALTLAKAHFHAGDRAAARKVIEKPAAAGNPEARRMLGMLLASGGEPFAGAAHLRAFIASRPKGAPADLEAVGALAHALKESGQADEALALLRPHVEARNANPRLLHLYAFTLNYAPGVSTADIAAAHRRYAAALEAEPGARAAPVHRIPPPEAGGERPRRLRIGLVSGDFRRHSVTSFLLPLLEHVGRGRFEIVCYSTHAAEDDFTRQYERQATHFRRVHTQNADELAATIASDRVHILIDLAGCTWNNRLAVFARRPAPVQVAWLGYPAPTGLSAMDFRVVDALTDAADGAPLAVPEQPLRLEPCMLAYRPYPDAPPVNERPAGAPLVLGCFGAVPKLNAPLLSLYARTLEVVPGSELLFRHVSLAEAGLREDLVKRVMAAGVKDRSRIKVEPPAPAEGSVMPAYHAVDISLDTFPYNGTTTLCESLWMGVPVVSLTGDRTASRMGLTILSRVGLPELAASSEDAFVNTAALLASDHQRRAELRRTLRARVQSALCDAGSFARAFEDALEQSWCARKP